MIEKILSGGQTGVDRAALDAAMKLHIQYGGWCPKGRIDEAGHIPERYSALKEISGECKSEKENYDTRTKRNIWDADGTLLLVPALPLPSHIQDGTLLTLQEVQAQKKPYLMLSLAAPTSANTASLLHWLQSHALTTLNIAGPRESTSPGIYQLSIAFLEEALSQWSHPPAIRKEHAAMPAKTVRLAEIKDIAPLASLFDAYRCFYSQPSNIATATAFLSERLTQKDSTVFVAETDTKALAGFIQLYPSFSSVAAKRIWILNDLYVDTPYRQSGIATKMIEAALAFAQATGAARVTLQTGQANTQAQALYKKLGFEMDDRFLTYRYEM